ncbi:MAG: hypothetical protein JWP88_1350 [Flaviaesturariibacter sp.]|nr:hypothetical protein [Flaviaesturariibacter sp.]
MRLYSIPRFSTFFLIGLLLFGPSCGSAHRTLVLEKDWELLGQGKVDFVRDVDEIDVTSDNAFTTIKFRVEDRAVHINDLKIYFTNGDKLEPSLDDEIAADQYSREIQLSPEGRRIDRIQFKYRTTGNVLKGRANVLVLGRRYNLYGN